MLAFRTPSPLLGPTRRWGFSSHTPGDSYILPSSLVSTWLTNRPKCSSYCENLSELRLTFNAVCQTLMKSSIPWEKKCDSKFIRAKCDVLYRECLNKTVLWYLRIQINEMTQNHFSLNITIKWFCSNSLRSVKNCLPILIFKLNF